MLAHAIVRVFCVDGPCRGMRYLDIDTGRVLFDEESLRLGVWYVYRISPTRLSDTELGASRNAYYE
jgi:hypothetical protein